MYWRSKKVPQPDPKSCQISHDRPQASSVPYRTSSSTILPGFYTFMPTVTPIIPLHQRYLTQGIQN